jgi:hypothetical protein
MLFGVGKAGNIGRFEKIPAHKRYPARVNCESLLQLENASNELIACIHGGSSAIFGETTVHRPPLPFTLKYKSLNMAGYLQGKGQRA